MDNLNNLDNMDDAIEVAIDNDEPNKINVTIAFIINPAISSDCYEWQQLSLSQKFDLSSMKDSCSVQW